MKNSLMFACLVAICVSQTPTLSLAVQSDSAANQSALIALLADKTSGKTIYLAITEQTQNYTRRTANYLICDSVDLSANVLQLDKSSCEYLTGAIELIEPGIAGTLPGSMPAKKSLTFQAQVTDSMNLEIKNLPAQARKSWLGAGYNVSGVAGFASLLTVYNGWVNYADGIQWTKINMRVQGDGIYGADARHEMSLLTERRNLLQQESPLKLKAARRSFGLSKMLGGVAVAGGILGLVADYTAETRANEWMSQTNKLHNILFSDVLQAHDASLNQEQAESISNWLFKTYAEKIKSAYSAVYEI